MPIVTSTTTSSGTRTVTTSTIPVWLIKLITVILCSVILFILYLLDNAVRAYYPKTFILIGVTIGALLGWSIGSVLQQIFNIRYVEITINGILTAMSVISFVLVLLYVFDTKDSASSNRFKLMIGAAVCLCLQSIVCLLMLSWAWSGNVIYIRT